MIVHHDPCQCVACLLRRDLADAIRREVDASMRDIEVAAGSRLSPAQVRSVLRRRETERAQRGLP